LGVVFKAMGICEKAEPPYQKAMLIFKPALGEKHPDYASRMDDFAHLLNQGDRGLREGRALVPGGDADFQVGPRREASGLCQLLKRFRASHQGVGCLGQEAMQVRMSALGGRHPDCAISTICRMFQGDGDLRDG